MFDLFFVCFFFSNSLAAISQRRCNGGKSLLLNFVKILTLILLGFLSGFSCIVRMIVVSYVGILFFFFSREGDRTG